MRNKLVPAKIESADDYWAGGQLRCHLPISLVLLLLRRQRIAIDEEIFRAEKPDALRPALKNPLGVGGLLDVRREHDAHAVQGHSGLFPCFAQLLFERDLPPRQLAVFE